MLRTFSQAIFTTALLSTTARASSAGSSSAADLCALPTASLVAAASQYSDYAAAIEQVNQYAIATWYTDRDSVASSTSTLSSIAQHCDESTRMTLVVYGLPNKDCDAGYSSGGLNTDADDYKSWVQTLADSVGQRKVLYVLEPDAVGLLANDGCGVANGYADNIKTALQILSQNPNADIYLDVGYWSLLSVSEAAGVASTVKSLASAGRLKGIALNTSNYRPNQQMADACTTFQTAYGDKSLNCIVDTSRNYNQSPPNTEWCNANFGGIGLPPTSNTGFDNLDYFVWIKPAGESDGTCDGSGLTSNAMKGPAAGTFFKDDFVVLWNNGYFVKEKYQSVIDGSGSGTTPATTSPNQSTPSTDSPTTQSPTTTTPAPVSQSPVVTDAPVTEAPTTPSTAPATEAPSVTTSAPVTNAPTATTTAPVTQAPVTTTAAPVAQQSTTPTPASAAESREMTMAPESTPAATTAKPKKKCDSNLEQLPEDLEAENAAVSAPEVNSTSTTYDKTMSFSLEDAHSAPAVATSDASTQHSAASSSGLGGGVIAAIVVAGVVVVAVAAVTFRRRFSDRRRANSIRTPAEQFGQISVTPARVSVL